MEGVSNMKRFSEMNSDEKDDLFIEMQEKIQLLEKAFYSLQKDFLDDVDLDFSMKVNSFIKKYCKFHNKAKIEASLLYDKWLLEAVFLVKVNFTRLSKITALKLENQLIISCIFSDLILIKIKT